MMKQIAKNKNLSELILILWAGGAPYFPIRSYMRSANLIQRLPFREWTFSESIIRWR